MKFSLYSKKNVLDEMQEQTMRKIERRGFWLMWGGLLAAMVIQQLLQFCAHLVQKNRKKLDDEPEEK